MKCESGRSMIEMLGVLAIMGVLTVGAIEMIQMAMNTQKRNTVNEEVLQIVTQVRNLHSEYDDFSNLNTATIFSAIGMSEKNPYGGNYEVAVDSANPRQFVVSITGLSKNECETFVTKGWQDSVGHRLSDGKSSGAMSPENCSASNGRNSVQIIYGE
ncbi:MAG: type II secretion system protein [Alphaproteobacteria bacterium]|nr:type II secretion system protein [Alphaproteobacteria bacterium]